MSRYWTCPCNVNWFACNKHKWWAKDGPRINNAQDESIRPKRSARTEHKLESEESNASQNKGFKKQHGATKGGEGDPNLMVSHQQLLEQEEMNWIASLHPKNVRPKDDITLDGTGVVTKKPRVLGPKLSARFGVQLSELVNKDGDNKATQHSGYMVMKRSCENISKPEKT